MPGVSMKTSCEAPSIAMPRTGIRVVCTLWLTIETLLCTSALISVDLPALGAPISAMKPQRLAPSWSCVSGIGANPLSCQEFRRCRLLGCAFGAAAAFRRLVLRQ